MSKMLSNPAMVIWVLLIASPLFWSLGSEYEGQYLPVVKSVKIEQSLGSKDGTLIYVSFDKVRQCQFIGISWYDEFNIRKGVEFEPDAKFSPISRPNGEQLTGPWLVRGLDELT